MTKQQLSAVAGMIRGGSPTVFVADLDRAVDFYTRVLGLGLQFRAGPHFAMIDAGDGLVIGLHPPEGDTPTPGSGGSTQVGLNVTQPIDQVVSELRRRGVKFLGPIIDDGPVKLALFHDSEGNTLYLCEMVH